MHLPEIITRKEARARGLRWYFTGRPCPAGHVAKRSIGNADCRACVDARRRRQRRDDPAALRAKDKRWRDAHINLARQRSRDMYAKHREKRQASDRARYPGEADLRKARARAWQKRNPGMLRYFVARRRAALLQATPRWLTRDQRRQIRQLYLEAASRPGDWHVDHIVPLRGKGVCGLNVPWNLQIIPASVNRAKSNRF